MTKTRKCAHCGTVFTTNSGMQRYCSEECAERAKEARKKRQRDFLHAVEPMTDLQRQEYLTFSKAAILLGCTRQYVYKLVGQGKLPASRLSSRMALIRRSDIERMFEANPYNRVLPCSKSKIPATKKQRTSSSKTNPKKTGQSEDVPEYYSSEEVMLTYKVRPSWLYTCAKRHQIPVCRIAGRNYYSKKHIDAVFGVSYDMDSITEWITAVEAEGLYGMKPTALRSYAHRHHIPAKREYGQVYYSKIHLDELRRTDLISDDRYYTSGQVAEKYGMTKSNVGVIAKTHHITKVKVGVRNLLMKDEIDKVMADRMAQFGSYRLQ